MGITTLSNPAPSKRQILEFMGALLLIVQTAERMLNLVICYILQKPGSTAESLLIDSQKSSRRTTGYFLKELHKRADIHPGFDQTLTRYLKNRNIFAHTLSDLPGWDLDTEEGRGVAARFLMELANTALQVTSVFGALTRLWAKQIKLKTDFDHDPLLEEIVQKFGPLLKIIFTAKEKRHS
jgi:hypothetical protein